jgi:hypothetical protein
MKKLRLDLDDVAVESFPTAPKVEVKGTVDGHLRSRVGDTWCITCFEYTYYCSADNDTCTCPTG